MTLTNSCYEYPGIPHFIKGKWDLLGIRFLFFLCFFFFIFRPFFSLLKHIDCGYSPHRGGSVKYPQSPFKAKITKLSLNIKKAPFLGQRKPEIY